MRRLGLPLVLLAVLGALLLRPQAALGHAALVRSEPAANSFLQQAPRDVTLVFSESIDASNSGVRLLDAAGGEVALEGTQLVNSQTLQARLPALEPGIYNVLWANVSSVDGHALRGAFPFTVLNADGSLPSQINSVGGVTTDADTPPLADGVAVRLLSLLGLLIAAGCAVVILVGGAPLKGAHRGFARAILLGAAILTLGALLNLANIRDVYQDVGLVDLVLHSRTGGYWLARLGAAVLVGVLAAFVVAAPRRAAVGVLGAGAVMLWSYSATSHAAAGAGSAWASGLDFVHAVAAVAWIGAVIGLALAARLLLGSGEYRRLMPRFSLLASATVFVLLMTGLLSAFVELDTFDRLWTTRYGETLLVKLGLGLLLLLVAAYNAKRARRALETRQASGVKRFLATATIEVGLGLLVFAAAAALTQTTAAKSIYTQGEARPFDQTTTMAGLNVRLAIDPNRTGLNTYRVTLTDAARVPVEAERVRLTFRYREDQTVGPATLVLAASAPGAFTGQGPYLTLEGQWRVEAEVRRANVDDVTAFFDVRPAGSVVNTIRSGGAWANPAPGLTWNQLGGIALVMGALGLALFKTPFRRLGKRASWVANGASVFGFGMGALLLFGVHSHEGTAKLPANPIFPDQNSIATGRALYQQNCVTCHGQTGVPPKGLDLNPYPLDLTVHVPQHPDGVLFNFIKDGIAGTAMQAWGTGKGKLSEDQIWHLVNYLRTLGAVDR